MSGPFGSSQWMYASGAEAESQSLRFNDDDTAYLSRTPASAGNRKTWTWSGWVKRGNVDDAARHVVFGGGQTASGVDITYIEFKDGDNIRFAGYTGSVEPFSLITTSVYRDASAWYHVVAVFDTSQATSSDRVSLYINGEKVTAFSTENYPSQNYDGGVNSTQLHVLGRDPNAGQLYFDGYLAEVNFVDGTALDPTSFGETDANGQWVPIIAPSVTYGTNGFYLPFLNGIGNDESGNSNDFTANSIATTDLMLDSPLNNFSTMNPLASSATLSEGNLRSQYSGSGDYKSAASTMSISSGKWYVELRITLSNVYPGFGIADTTTLVASDPVHTSYLGKTSNGVAYYPNNGFFTNNAIDQSSTVTVSSGDIIGIAIDLDSAQNTYKIYQNGTLAETYNINAPANAYAFCESTYTANSAARADWNFGQDSSFHGLETAQGNQDDNGVGDFYYTPPSGFLALCTDNLPDPTIGDGSEHFNTVLWTGDNSSPRSITGVGFDPDFVWIKERSTSTYWHVLFDELRGGGQLATNNTDAELVAGSNVAGYVSSFDTDGFTLTTGSSNINSVNGSSLTYVGWNWKANGSGVSNTDGSVSSTVSANTTAGFSIVSYTGTSAASATIGHGLGVAPTMYVVRDRTTGGQWAVYHEDLGNNKKLDFSNTNASSISSFWDNTSPTSTVFTVRNTSTGDVFDVGRDYIAYCFHNVDGFSKFGSYEGNGSSDGPFVYTGFRPAFVMVKSADNSTGAWVMYDNARGAYNLNSKKLRADETDAENAAYVGGDTLGVDFVSNGFKHRNDGGANHNTSGETYIYMAFAESPFKYSNAR